MPERITVRRRDIPAFKPPTEPDTPTHSAARKALFGLVGAFYALIVLAWLAGAGEMGWVSSVFFGAFIVVTLPAIHYGVRPGKATSWVITLLLLPIVFLLPIVVFVVPFLALIRQARQQRRTMFPRRHVAQRPPRHPQTPFRSSSWMRSVPRRRQLCDDVDDQAAPVWFVLVLHATVHLLGLYALAAMPDTWPLGVHSAGVSVPPFQLIVWVCALSLVWSCLRLISVRGTPRQVIVLLLIPPIMSFATLLYAQALAGAADVGRATLEAELRRVTTWIQQDHAPGRPAHDLLAERSRLLEQLGR
jgi:hypothetical protein